MSKITPELIKKLRESTQAGMMDCKKALEESQGDFDKAVNWLREKGIAKAGKKVGMVAAEGMTHTLASGNDGYIFELNCQTDFTAGNDNFRAIATDIANAVAKTPASTIAEVLNLKAANHKTISETITDAVAKIGEKIELRRFTRITKTATQTFGVYVHNQGKSSCLVLLDANPSSEVGKNIAMQIVAMNPKFIDSTQVDQKWLENEKNILMQQTIAEGKPAAFAEKIVQGRISKLLSENCAVDQEYIKDPAIKVGQYLKDNKTKLLKMLRYEVGEGIEKQEVNFAEEVEAQMKAARK